MLDFKTIRIRLERLHKLMNSADYIMEVDGVPIRMNKDNVERWIEYTVSSHSRDLDWQRIMKYANAIYEMVPDDERYIRHI